MGGNSFSVQVAIHNKTITDITTMVVSPDKPSMKPFTVPIPAGNSHELELSERQCKVSIKTTFRNGANDNFNIILDSEQQSLIKIEKEIETHSISVQQDNKKVTITFENTKTQIENHEAESIYLQAKILIIKEKFNEASAKLDEALEKGNETTTITAILASISDLEKNRAQKAKLMRDEGLTLLSQNNYEEALNKFTHCLQFAKERTIITSIHNNISKIDKMKESQDKCEEIVRQAKTLSSQHRYKEALKEFEEALTFAQKEETVLAITKSMNEVEGVQRSQEKSEEIVKVAETLLGKHLYGEALKKFQEALIFAKKKQTVEFITRNINKTRRLKVDQDKAEEMKKQAKCEEIVRQAKTFLSQHRYKEALKEFEEALTYAQKEETVLAITKSMNEVEGFQRSQEKSEEIVNVAEASLSNHSYEEALKKFEEALIFAKKKPTVELITCNINKTRKLKVDEDNKRQAKCEEIVKQANTLSSQDRYEEALKEFEKALTYAQKEETVLAITKSMNEVDVMRSQKKSEGIVKVAEELLSKHFYEEALKKFEEALIFAKKEQTVELITSNINKTRTLKTDEDKAEKIKKQAEALMEEHKYKLALNKFYQALKYTHKDIASLKENIAIANSIKKKERKALELNKEAEAFLEDHCYGKALWKIEEALKLTKNPETLELIKSNKTRVQQEDNDSTAIKLNAEGLLLDDAKAIKKFNQALKIAREETLINHIKMNKAKVFNKQGEGVLAEVRIAEEQRFAKVGEKLAHAKNLFLLANDVYPSRKYEDNIKIVDSKIHGNKFYKAGVKLEEEAALLVEKIESSSVEEAISKYISVRECYKNALEEFTEGMKINEEKFKFSVGVVNAALNGVMEVLDELEWRKLTLV